MSPGVHTARLFTILGAVVLLTASQFSSFAQDQTFNAAGQARARMQQNHKRTGSIGNGYRPWSAWAYQNSAKTNTQILNAYGKNCKELPAETAKEHLTQIRKDIVASKAELGKLGPDAAKEADVKQQVNALEKQLTECEHLCDMMEKSIGKNGVETVQLCAHCSGLEEKLKAAEKEHRELLNKLGIELPLPANDHSDQQNKPKSN